MNRRFGSLTTSLLPGYRRGIALCVWLALLCAPARAGWIEDRLDGTTIHVKLFDLPNPARTDPASRAEVAAMKEFLRRFPETFAQQYRAAYEAHPEIYGRHDWRNVRVELHRFSGIRVEGVEGSLLAIAGGVAPDILYVNFRQSDTYIQQGFLYPLDLPEDGYYSALPEAERSFRIHPKILPVIDRKGPQGTRHIWALPYGGALGRVVLYRKDLFDEVGLAYPSNHWTWSDFEFACRRLTNPARGIYGLGLGRGKHESWYWTSFLWSAGGDILAYDETNDQWSVLFDSRAGAEALDFYVRLCTEPWADRSGRKRYGYALKDAAESYAKWERGQIGMMFAYVDEKMFSSINPDITGMVPVPVGPQGQRGAELNSKMMGIFAGVRERAIRDAAWEYMKFCDSRDALEIKTRVLVESGMGRFVNPRYLREFGYDDIIRLTPAGWEETFHIAIETGRPEPYGKDSNYAYDILTRPIREAEEAALLGKLPAEYEQRLGFLQDLLRQAAARARAEMLGTYTPRVLRVRRATAWLFIILLVCAFGAAFRQIARAYLPAGAASPVSVKAHWRRYAPAYLLLLPAALAVLVFQYIPLLQGSLMAFADYRIMGNSLWVGVDNFAHLLWDPDWWGALWNSARYSFLVIALTFLPPVFLAIMLQEIPRGKILFRTLFYLPAVISGLVVILLWKSFYDPSERGALNAILLQVPVIVFLALGGLLLGLCGRCAARLWRHEAYAAALVFALAGLALADVCATPVYPLLLKASVPWYQRLWLTLPEPFRWLDQSRTAMVSCVLPMLWAGLGPGCLIYLAALKGIPDDYYEAADLDGASFTDKILFVVFPLLRPLLLINFIGVFIASWNAEANILAMTGGAARTEVAGLHIFYKAFIFLKFGPAAAMAWMLGFMLIGFTMCQLRFLARLEFKTTGDAPGK